MIKNQFTKVFALLVVGLFFTLTAFSHSVQVQYCVSCNGDLRIWIEHWHGNQNPSSTSMTISLDINGTVTTQNSAPGGAIMNTASGALPGCSTPITYVTGCPGEQNTYNDWVYYDFTGLPPNVPITFTILSGNTVFTTDGCGMFPLSVTFTLASALGNGANQNICQGQSTTALPFDPTATWTNSNPAIGLPANGTGPIPSFIATGAPGTTATINFTNSCTTGSFTYTINPTPVPGFTVASNGVPALAICEGNTFDFTNTSTIGPPGIITTWLWDFGDGNSSSVQDPSYTYANPGTYTVDLSVTSDSGCVLNFSQIVTVAPTPVAAFNVAPTCSNIPSAFIDASTLSAGIFASWQWDFGNGTTSNVQSPNYQYPAIGSYTIQLIVTSATGCIDSITQTTDIYEVPVANFLGIGGCANDPATFTDLSTISVGGLSWDWDFGDFIGTSNTQNGTYQYLTDGTYLVELIVQSVDGCFDSITIPVVMLAEPIADFNFTNDCYYNAASFTDASTPGIIAWQWDFGDGNTSNSTNPWNSYTMDGTYTVQLIVDAPGSCSDTITQVITRYPQPVADFSVADECLNIAASFNDLSTINAPGAVTAWDWDFGDAGISNSSSPSHIYPAEGTYTITFTAISSYGCTDDATLSVVIHPIPQTAFTSSQVCVNEPPSIFTDASTISFGSNVAWAWQFGDGNASGIQNPTNMYATNGEYYAQLTVTSDFGCINSITDTVTVFEKPLAFFMSDYIKICDSNCIEFTDLSASATSAIVEWDWNFDLGYIGTSQHNTTCYLINSEFVEYFDVELIVRNAFGCYDTMFVEDYITVVPQPVASFTYAPSASNVLDPLVSFTNQSDFSSTYYWDFGDLNSSSTEVDPEFMYSYDGGDYEVTLIAMSIDNGYCQDTISTIITIHEVVLFYVPNSFTPDGDMHNNTFLPILSSGYDPFDYHLSIFNRWGEVIFESYDVRFGWDGTYGGQGIVPNGTYTWTIEFKESMTDQRHSKNGHVTLIR